VLALGLLSSRPTESRETQEVVAGDLPDVLILGDSISIGYTPLVRKLLEGEARVVRPMVDGKRPENCQYTAYGLRRLEAWLGDTDWEVIHFNWGLHDLKYVDQRFPNPSLVRERGDALLANDEAHQLASVDEYAANLAMLVERLEQTGARLVFATTTPVPEGVVGRIPGDELRYNTAAGEVMEERGIAVDDLYGLVANLCRPQPSLAEVQRKADVHFTRVGNELLADQVSRAIRAELQRESDTLDLGAAIRPLPKSAIFEDPEWFNWGGELIRAPDGTYHLFYARWPRELGFGAWLTDSEIAVATAQSPTGPWTCLYTALKGRGPGYWDELSAHNPKIKSFGGRYYLYYTSSRSAPTRSAVRNSQRTGVAFSDSLVGPWERLDQPIAGPAPPIHQIAVNPGITITPEGDYLLIVKGDRDAWNGRMGQRVQVVARGPTPTGPFAVEPRPAIRDFDTEDASLWHDSRRGRYYAIFHAHSFLGLITSIDGVYWTRAQHFRVCGKSVPLQDGGILRPDRFERPCVFRDPETSEPRALVCAVKRGEDSFNVQIPLAPGR
jgi:hypothetical protein